MMDVPVQVVVAAFKDEGAADEVLAELRGAEWAGLIGIREAAVILRDEENKLHIKEPKDWGGGKGAVVGGLVGGFIGLLTGPVGLIGITVAVVGGLAAKLRDSGIPGERLKQIGDALPPGSSALIAVIEHRWVKDLENQLSEAGAEVMTETISADIARCSPQFTHVILPIPVQLELDFTTYHEFDDPYRARWTVVRMWAEGWNRKSTAYLTSLASARRGTPGAG